MGCTLMAVEFELLTIDSWRPPSTCQVHYLLCQATTLNDELVVANAKC